MWIPFNIFSFLILVWLNLLKLSKLSKRNKSRPKVMKVETKQRVRLIPECSLIKNNVLGNIKKEH